MTNKSDTERPIAADLHPIETGNYRIPTPAIETFHELVVRCLHYRIPGALIYGPSRIGKTRAIEYMRLLRRNAAQNYHLSHPVDVKLVVVWMVKFKLPC